MGFDGLPPRRRSHEGGGVLIPLLPALEHYGVELRGSSRFGEQTALCPVHGESRPSLRVNVEKGVLYCQACEFKGTALHLIMAMESCGKAEALTRLEAMCKAAGVEMKQSTSRRYRRPGEGRPAASGRKYVPPGRRSA